MASRQTACGRQSQDRKVLEHVESEYNRGKVVARGRTRHLEVNGATYASYHPQRRFFGYAWDALAAAALHHAAAVQGGAGMRVLMIGMGGGTVLHTLRLLLPHAEVVTVEIDGALVDISRRHFALDQTQAKVIVGDGYAHLDANPAVYDVILDDAFLARGEAERVHTVGRDFLARMRRGLRPSGLLACNVFTDLENAAACAAARSAFAAAFASSFALVPPRGENAIHCGSDMPRGLKEVMAHVRALPRGTRTALERIRCVGTLTQRRMA